MTRLEKYKIVAWASIPIYVVGFIIPSLPVMLIGWAMMVYGMVHIVNYKQTGWPHD